MTERIGTDERRRGFFWGPTQLIRQWAPLIGLDGIGLLISYDVWCDRREGSATEGYAFPSRDEEAAFYGCRKEELGVLTSILTAAGWLRVQRLQYPIGHGRGNGGVVYRRKNLYRLVDRDWNLTLEDVLNVLELADKDPRVFKRIRHLFRSDFQPINEKDNPWHTILPQIRQHPLWQKLAAKERAHAIRIRCRFGAEEEKLLANHSSQIWITGSEEEPNRQSVTGTTGSEGEPNRQSVAGTAGSEGSPNRQSIIGTTGTNRSSLTRQVGLPTVHIRDGKDEDDDEADRDKEVFRFFAFLVGYDSYTPSRRDLSALRALRTEGYSHEDILVGIWRAVAWAQARGTQPRRFTYCIPAIRQASPRECSCEISSQPAPAAPVAVPSALSAASHSLEISSLNPSDSLFPIIQELGNFARARGLFLEEATLCDLARLAQDYEPIAAKQGETGLFWVQQALRKVDSQVRHTARYVRAILEERERASRAASLTRLVPTDPSPEHFPQEACRAEFPEEVSSETGEALWERALGDLRLEMTAATFYERLSHTRLRGIRQRDNGNGTIWIVEVRSSYDKEWLETQLRPVILRVLSRLYPDTTGVEFVVSEEGSDA